MSARIGRGVAVVAAVAMLVATAGACAKKAAAKTEPDMPLEVPAPPPRLVAPVEPLPTAPPPEAPKPAPPRTPLRPAARQPLPAPPETKPDETPVAAPEPPRMLQTMPTGGEDEAVRRVRDVLARATADLGRVKLVALSPDERAQYETARRFVQQADDALKARNLVFAGTLADKAATLAAGLLGR